MAGKVHDVLLPETEESKEVNQKTADFKERDAKKRAKGFTRVTSYLKESNWVALKTIANNKGIKAEEMLNMALDAYLADKQEAIAKLQEALKAF